MDYLREKHSHFLVARVILKLGREVPENFRTIEEDRALASQVRSACAAMGIKNLPPA